MSEQATLRIISGVGAKGPACFLLEAEGKRLRAIADDLFKAVREGRYQDAIGFDFDLHTAIVGLAHHQRLADQHRFILQNAALERRRVDLIQLEAIAEERAALTKLSSQCVDRQILDFVH